MWTGTVTNAGSDGHSYTIVVDFTDAAATVEQTKVVKVHVDAGGTASWSVAGAAGLPKIVCVIRSARFS